MELTQAGERALSDPEWPSLFLDAMASFPSGVTLVTTTDRRGSWCGFTATSFCSVSAAPPLVLVCLAKSARCHPVFLTAPGWVVQVLPEHHADLSLTFATRDADKFAHGIFRSTSRGHPVLDDACAVVECEAYARHDAGDHTILVGSVTGCQVSDDLPLLYFRRAFSTLRGEADLPRCSRSSPQ
jgi:flavin reductase ActVB